MAIPQDEKPAADTEKRYEVTPDVAREFGQAMQAQRECAVPPSRSLASPDPLPSKGGKGMSRHFVGP